MNEDSPFELTSWLSSDTCAHPDSPAGGTGLGFSVPAISESLKWTPPHLPNPNSPQARFFDWTSQSAAGPDSLPPGLVLQAGEVRQSFLRHFNSLREALPESSLRTYFDRQNTLAAIACGAAHNPLDAAKLLRQLRIEARWFNHPPGQPFYSYDAEVLLARAPVAMQFGSTGEQRRLLDDIQECARQMARQTVQNIQAAWMDASRSRKRAELIAAWTLRMRWIDDLGGGGGGNAGDTAESSEQPDQSPKRASDSPQKSKKTWVEFQLVDSEGKPVAGEKYLVTLPSGSRESGSLDAQGSVRFDGIDPGQCQITFPDIDAREWHPL